MSKTIAEKIFESYDIKIEPKEERTFEKVLLNIFEEHGGPHYKFISENVVVPIFYQPKTQEEKKCAEMLVKVGLLAHRPGIPHQYNLTTEGYAQLFDVIYGTRICVPIK